MSESQRVEVAILGAGISGLVGASVLIRQGCESIAVVDEYDHLGGNHIDVTIGEYTFDIGSLIFQDDSPLLDHFPYLMDRYIPVEPAWSRLNPQGVITEYPFSLRDDFLAAGMAEATRLAGSALRWRADPRRLRSAHDFARRAVGSRFLNRSGLGHYMERFCGCPIDQIELAFAESRMAWVADQTRPGAVVERVYRGLRSLPPRPEENRQLVRPRGGFETLYAPVAADLESRGVTFASGAAIDAIVPEADGTFTISSGGRVVVVADRVVSTIPITRAMTLVGLVPPPLPTVTLTSLFYSFAGDRGFDTSIFYNFSDAGTWKRLTVYSDFYGKVADREFFTVEVVGGVGRGAPDPAAADAEFRQHVGEHGLFSGDIVLEGHHVLEQAYPIYTRGSGDRAAAGRARLAGVGIESFGRQGGFTYQPTARVSTLEAEDALGMSRQ